MKCKWNIYHQKTNSTFATLCIILIFILISFLLAPVLKAQNNTFSNNDRTTFIIDIAQYVTWKNSKKIEVFRIGILDRDSSFYNDFINFSQNKLIQEKPLSVKLFHKIIDIEGVEILFVNRNTGFDIDLVYQQIKGKQVLLLSENYPFHKSMINFIVVNDKKRFEINQSRMDAEGFKVTVTFAALAVKSELDWHKIYTETEKELFEQKEKVTALNQEIEKQKEEIERQQQILSDLMSEINTQKNRLLLYVEEIELLEDEMHEQKLISDKLIYDIRIKQNILEAKETLLKKMTDEVLAKELENTRQEEILNTQSKAISEQDQQINQQKSILNKQLEQIHQQSLIINLAIALIIMFSILIYFIYRSYKIKKLSIIRLEEKNKVIKEQKKLVETEKEKTDTLLLNILPFKVAEDLKIKGFTEPEEFKDVSVFFSDFVGFTEISSRITPKKLIDELNDLYTAFDNIMQKHQCERIKTIGDAYMAVCGLPNSNPLHAQNIADAACQIIKYIKERNSNYEIVWNVRIGIHSGKVIGGIVGVNKFIYDIFGDTINVAARMESNSLPMHINVSETTYKLLSNQYTFEKRGAIEVKGKGKTNMYFLVQ